MFDSLSDEAKAAVRWNYDVVENSENDTEVGRDNAAIMAYIESHPTFKRAENRAIQLFRKQFFNPQKNSLSVSEFYFWAAIYLNYQSMYKQLNIK
jgi:hypothetical protein